MQDFAHSWEINPTSRYHFRTWPDGVAVYLEGEGGTYLLHSFAAELLQWLMESRLSSAVIAERLLDQYPDDTLENITAIVEQTLAELRTRGFVIRVGT